jgi:hypothetical protein
VDRRNKMSNIKLFEDFGKNIVKNEGYDIESYIPDSKPVETEENYALEDMYVNEHDKLIRYEMNAIELPLFSKDKKIKELESRKYIFDNTKDQYVEVIPSNKSKIPQEFDERIFLAIMRIYQKQQYKNTIYTDYYTLIDEASLNHDGKIYKRTEEALERLSETSYVFNNIFYSNEYGNIQNDKIKTNIFSVRIISFKSAKENGERYMQYFRNSKIKEVIEVKLSPHFYENIVRKGFLYFDYDNLLQIDNSVARTLYTMLTKWRNGELYIKRHSKLLASRIPLSWKSKNITNTIRTIEGALNYLKEKNLIKGFKYLKEKKHADSYFEVYFEISHNNNFIKRKKTGQEEIEILDISQPEIIPKALKSEYELIFNDYEEKIKIIIKEKISYETAIEILKNGKGKNIEFLLFCLEKSINESTSSINAYFSKIVKHPNMIIEFNEYNEKRIKKEKKQNDIETKYYEKEKMAINSIEDYANSVGKEVEDLSTLDLRIYKSLSVKR